MADQYEIREDSSNKYWPFTVWNLTENWEVGRRFPTREEAQAEIDKWVSGAYELDENLFNLLPDPDYPESWGKAQPSSETEKAPEEEAEFVSNVAHKVGEEIADDGHVYLVIQNSYYISERDAADIEDGWDAQVSVGWHTLARLKSTAIEVVVEQVQAGAAEIMRRDSVTCVRFTGIDADKDEIIPLDDLAYSSEMGLYQKSQFPNQ